jgi:hypothetical protein
MCPPALRMTTRPAVPKRPIRRPWAEVVLGLLPLFQIAHAEPTWINGHVVSVADGDTSPNSAVKPLQVISV